MSSWKCNKCGLVNFATLEACRRCQTSATGAYAANQYPQGNFQANHSAPQTNYQTGNLSPQLPQESSNHYTQNGGYPPNNSYQQNNYAQGNAHFSGGDSSQNNGYANHNPYSQNNGYAYNNGAINPGTPPSQPYTNYSQAPSYGAPSTGAYQQAYSAGYGGQGQGVWRDGKKLVMHKQALLPDRCVKCNAPTNRFYLNRKLSWMHPACKILLIFGLLGWIIYAILSATIRKKAQIDLGLCDTHLSSRRTNTTIGWALAVFGLFFIVLSFSAGKPVVIFLGIVMFIGGVMIASLAINIVTVAKMDDNYVWMNRIHQDYLSNFPASGGF